MRRLVAAAVCAVAAVATADVHSLVVTGAPFELTVAEWTPPARDFPVTAYGAKADGTPATEAIEAAIAAAHAAGGGRVVFPKGEWLSGAFRLKSDVALSLAEDAVLHFPDDPVVVYRSPLLPNGRPQPTCRGLIEAVGCTNVAILGRGTLKADVDYWHRNFQMNPKRGFPRPQFFHFTNCRNVRFEGFKVRGSPAWSMHFAVCEDLVLRDLDSIATGPNTDGLDLESCNRALVERVSLDQTDDTFTIKSGMNEAGRRRNIPTQNVVIRNCRAVHGHSLLGIGSEVSGGIRNIYMTDCTVDAECWNWLFVKTNAKRGAFVENVTLENIRGKRASSAVMNVEMYYDGNPNKELTKKDGPSYVTKIGGITCRNIVCDEAGAAVKVNGDRAHPPTGLKAENIRVGRLRKGRTEPVVARSAPDLAVQGVRVDPSASSEVHDLPAGVCVRQQADESASDVVVDLVEWDAYSENEIFSRVLAARIAAETARGRDCSPVVRSSTVEGLEGGIRARRLEALAEWGCALPGSYAVGNLQRVLRADASGRFAECPGVALSVSPDVSAGRIRVRLTNGGSSELTDVWGVALLPAQWMTRRQTFRVAKMAPGETVERTLELGAGAHYMPRPIGDSPYAVSVDLSVKGVRTRLWETTKVPTRDSVRLPVQTARYVGPLDIAQVDDDLLARISSETNALPALEGAAWQSPAFDGAAWYNVTGAARPYTAAETRLVRAERAVEVVALQFTVPEFAKAKVRATPALWDSSAALYLNGRRVALTGKSAELETRAGLNRLVLRFKSRPGATKACAQLAVSTWSVTDHVDCVPFPEGMTPVVQVTGAGEFPLEWNTTYETVVPYEVAISRRKLAKFCGVSASCGFSVAAEDAAGRRTPLAVQILPARTAESVRLRFSVPAGTARLFCRPQGQDVVPVEVADGENLLAGALAQPARWETTPRMSVTADPAGGLLFAAKDWGSPEAKLTVDVPKEWAGRGVVFECETQNVGREPSGRVIRLEQYDADGRRLAESVVDRRWTSHVCPPGSPIHYLEDGRLHPQAAKVLFYFSCTAVNREYDFHGLRRTKEQRADRSTLARHRVTRLSLRPAETLPFPKYDDAFFTAGVSGEAGDTALVLGGANGKAFWYQTRSQASWSDGKDLRDESLVFFPAGAGTVEAWFKSPWTPKFGDSRKATLPYTLFEAYNGFHAKEHVGGSGTLLSLAYRPVPGTLTAFFKEPTTKKTWTQDVPVKLPVDAWCHLALQWTPARTADVFVDGRRVMTMPIPGWKGCDLADRNVRVPNDANAQEFFLGATCSSARQEAAPTAGHPFLEGAVDLFRASSGLRYTDDFTPARKLAVDARTRALFSFDRVFDGRSGGGLGWIPGTMRALTDRVDHQLVVAGRSVPYLPKMPAAENDPRYVFDIVNYPVLPSVADFECARKPFSHTAELRPGESFAFEAPSNAVTDYVEIENVSATPLVLPLLLNAGDIDARSFSDLAETLGAKGTTPRERVDQVFQFVLSASDYFWLHTAKFDPGSDVPRCVCYDAFTMLNGYCGFECGPMNHLAANLFATVAGCPSSETAGYAHQFEQVFFDGKNHIYDLSAQKFFPAMDNETSAYLKEGGDQPGLFNRLGGSGDHFIRMGHRGFWLFSPKDVAKVGVTLNPGESFRVWQVNDGNCNDLISDSKTGAYRGRPSKEKIDMDAETQADTSKSFIQQVNRFFPHYLNGFLSFDGRPERANPAFTRIEKDAFCYSVSAGYPIVWADYAAKRADGSAVPLEISTDGGTTFRPFSAPATYAVRARFAYLIRVQAPIAEVARFTARTEVQLNPRVFPGRIQGGANRYTLKAVSGEKARVTVAGRTATKRLAVRGPVAYSGTVVGAERLFTAFDSARTQELTIEGLSPVATVAVRGNVTAKLEGARLVLAAKDPSVFGFGAVLVTDEGAEKELTVLTGPGIRFATAETADVQGGKASLVKPDATSPQTRAVFRSHCGDGSCARFRFDRAPAGKYAVFNLNRFISHPEQKAPEDLRMIWEGQTGKSIGCGQPRNFGCNFQKANYGRPGERANFKWDYPASASVIDVPASEAIRFFSWRNDPVEVAAVLVVPEPTREQRADTMKILCGLNTDPWRIHP